MSAVLELFAALGKIPRQDVTFRVGKTASGAISPQCYANTYSPNSRQAGHKFFVAMRELTC